MKKIKMNSRLGAGSVLPPEGNLNEFETYTVIRYGDYTKTSPLLGLVTEITSSASATQGETVVMELPASGLPISAGDRVVICDGPIENHENFQREWYCDVSSVSIDGDLDITTLSLTAAYSGTVPEWLVIDGEFLFRGAVFDQNGYVFPKAIARSDSPVFTGTPTAPTAAAGNSSTQLATTAFVAGTLSAKANLASPAFTGTPTAPTAVFGTKTAQLATTEFVQTGLSTKASVSSPAFEGTPTAPTPAISDQTTKIATTEFVQEAVSIRAALTSPAFTGTPTAPTATAGTNTTQLATTAFVAGALSTKANLASPIFTGAPTAPTATAGTNTTQLATTAFVSGALYTKANLASPIFTGTPTAPTAAAGNSSTQLATTAFVAGTLSAKANLASPAFTGTPTAPTPIINSTETAQIINTAYYISLGSTTTPLAPSATPTAGSGMTWARSNHRHPTTAVIQAGKNGLDMGPNLLRCEDLAVQFGTEVIDLSEGLNSINIEFQDPFDSVYHSEIKWVRTVDVNRPHMHRPCSCAFGIRDKSVSGMVVDIDVSGVSGTQKAAFLWEAIGMCAREDD